MTARPWSPVEVEVKLESGLDQLDDVMTGYLAIADDAGHDQIRIVENCAKGMAQRITQLTPFVDRARTLRRRMAWYAGHARHI